MKSVNGIAKTHSLNSWLNLFLSVFIVGCVFACVIANLLAKPTDIVQEVGLKTFRMFTVLSNMLVGIAAAMSIPFAVDGIRQKNYHLPRWIVYLNFVSVTGVVLTFLITLLVLSPRVGFVLMMLTRSNLFLHTLIPLVSVFSFLFINSYHNIKFKVSLFAVLPVLAYAAMYAVSAFLIGEDRGGWRDHYHFQEIMPWYCAFVIIILLAFGIANLLRVLHNYTHRRDKRATEFYYQNAPEYDLPTIEDAIIKIARENKRLDQGGEVTVPRRVIKILEKKYESKKTLFYLCSVYLEEYLK